MPERSIEAGKIDTWTRVSQGLSGDARFGTSLFYPPFALDQSNPQNIALGTNLIFLDTNQGTQKWRTSIPLPNLLAGELISAINYVNSDLIFVGTTMGKVYRLMNLGGKWTVEACHSSPLPIRFIWDVASHPNDVNTIFVVIAGFGSRQEPLSHVWRGKVSEGGVTIWTDISKWNNGRLPDIPVNAIVIEPNAPNTMYIGTDIGVYRTIDRRLYLDAI